MFNRYNHRPWYLFCVLVLVVALWVCVGCSGTIDAPPAMATCSDAGDGMYDCRLKDNTRCVVVIGANARAVSCNWQSGKGVE